MCNIDKSWWEHLVPKSLIHRRGDIVKLLDDFISLSEYGKKWYSVAKNPHGIFRLKLGDVIPVVHIILFDQAPGFVAPFKRLQQGHRSVISVKKFVSGNSLNDEERVAIPTIQIDLVVDQIFIEAAKNGRTKIDETLIKQPSQLFSIPAHYLFSPEYTTQDSYVLYQHIFGNGGTYPIDGYFYIGITTRSWQKRWSEHKRAINNGSPLLFHRKLSEEKEHGRISYIHHKIMGITNDREELYAAEEFLVEGHWQDQRRLNMIPGGKSGLRYLRENGLLQQSMVPMPDDRDQVVSDWLNANPRKGLPALWLEEKWRDNDWAIAQICSRKDRLSVQQVRAIRNLAEQFSAEEIYMRIGAKNANQVKRVLKGDTYTRVE